MFDLDASKIVIVGVAALIFIPPKDLPRVMRQVGQFVGKMRRMANEFQGQFMDAMREADMADLRKEAQKLSDAVRIETGLTSVHDIERHMAPSSDVASPVPAADPEPARSARAETTVDTRGELSSDGAGPTTSPPSPAPAALETHPTA